jgi:tRNA-guanine transglycosylase
MIDFKVIKQSKKSKARLGILKTSHGEVETPCLVPVATQATVKTLTSDEVREKTKTQMLIANTFHLHLKPGEGTVKKMGGLHRFMNWKGGLMTDSGGFQVFSLGFGRDLGTNKIIKNNASFQEIKKGTQPQNIKISDDGVLFRSPVDGKKIFLGPKESIKIQEALGSDIILAFDECPPPHASYDYVKKSLEKTNRWLEICVKAKKSNQALYGIVQGGRFSDLRVASARFVAEQAVDGYAIGGEFGNEKKSMETMLAGVIPHLAPEKPRHLLGIGHPQDIIPVIKSGIDTFDCIVPTHYARHGTAFTARGKLDMAKAQFKNSKKPLDTT